MAHQKDVDGIIKKHKKIGAMPGSTEPGARIVLEEEIMPQYKKKDETDDRVLSKRTAKDTHKTKTKEQGQAEKDAIRKKLDKKAAERDAAPKKKAAKKPKKTVYGRPMA